MKKNFLDVEKKIVQPPVFGPPFKLVSDDAFSAPSAQSEAKIYE